MTRIFSRRAFLAGGAGLGATMLPQSEATGAEVPAFELDEATVADLQAGMASGKYTAQSLAELYLQRIERVDWQGPSLRSVLEINPDALDIARKVDAERAAGKLRGPLHGIPVLLKDNIGTADRMETTAGSLALVGARPAHNAPLATCLIAAGAVLLGKTNLSEWANFRSTHSVSGWSGRGGQTRNPYALDRSPSGSSSGSGAAIAANLAALAVGTETDGSILSPSAANSLVGIKPTVGLISRTGVIPIAHSQDTAGPMARTVRDAAILLGALVCADPADAATQMKTRRSHADYTPFLDPHGLKGKRIGITRKQFFGYSAPTDHIATEAIEVLKKAGAVIVDPADIPSAGKFDADELIVLLYEFKADLNRYLSGLGPNARVHSLQEVIAFNDQEKAAEMPFFGQEHMLKAEELGPLTTPAYKKALARCGKLSRAQGIDAVMNEHQLDALFAPTQGPVWMIDLANGDSGGGSSTTPAAVSGYPSITVPAGYYYGLPVGVSFFGRPWSEPTLIEIAYAFEQATQVRRPPKFAPTAAFPTLPRASGRGA
ncbi:MAG TPA: amidase [Chthonomonadaceae bacterium]|nr:amidase [Chthonomonadaceae bacterium]